MLAVLKRILSWVITYNWVAFLAAGLTMIQVGEYAAAFVCWILAAISIFAKFWNWMAKRKKYVRTGSSFLVAVLFLAFSSYWTYVVMGDRPWSNLIRKKPDTRSAENTSPIPPGSTPIPSDVTERPMPPEPPPIHIEQRSTGPNSPNVATFGENSPITINPEVNPYDPTITYDFNGVRRITSPGKVSVDSDLEEYTFFTETMEPFKVQERWQDLANACDKQIYKTPQWLTPYLYSGIALANLGRKAESIERLRFVHQRAAGNPEYSDAQRYLKILESQ